MTRIEEERIDEMLADKFGTWLAIHGTPNQIEVYNDFFAREIEPKLKELRAQGGVRVKGLEWLQDDANEWGAGSLFGHYGVVREDVDLFSAEGPQGHFSLHNSLEQAKAAAESDYRTRILSALETEAPHPAVSSLPTVTGDKK